MIKDLWFHSNQWRRSSRDALSHNTVAKQSSFRIGTKLEESSIVIAFGSCWYSVRVGVELFVLVVVGKRYFLPFQDVFEERRIRIWFGRGFRGNHDCRRGTIGVEIVTGRRSTR